jgi:hypothetical protein
MSSAAWAKQYMSRWLDAANHLDIDAIVALYADDAELTSPVVVEILHEPSGTIRGLPALRDYFQRAFASVSFFQYQMVEAAWSRSSLTCWYVNHKGTRSTAFIEFDPAGKIRRHVNHFSE